MTSPYATARYVVGFMLDAQRENVVLIEKNRPAWQAGRLNGVGGKVEVDKGEFPREAMAREFEEETGQATSSNAWKRMCSIAWNADDARGGPGPAQVDFYRYVAAGRLDPTAIQTRTDEPVLILPVSTVNVLPVIPNLRWLVPLACYTADLYAPFMVQATIEERFG